MGSAFIVRRKRAKGYVWQVRYRLGGRESKVMNGGTFERRRDAEERRDCILAQMRKGKVPDLDLAAKAAKQATKKAQRAAKKAANLRTVGQAVSEYIAWRTSLAPGSIKVHRKAEARLASLAGIAVKKLTDSDIQKWIYEMEAVPLKESTIRKYLETLQMTLDREKIHPNPARDRQLQFRKEGDDDGDGSEGEVTPPSFAEYIAIYEGIAPVYRLAVDVMEATGIRVGEATLMIVDDINARDCQLRVAKQRTKGKRGTRRSRFVDVPPALMARIQEHVEEKGLGSEDRIIGFTDQGLRNAMARACAQANIPLYSPHDLRHRFASVRAMAKWPAPVIAKCLGHKKTSITLDTYAHVLTEEPDWLIDQLREQQERGASVVSSRYPQELPNEERPA